MKRFLRRTLARESGQVLPIIAGLSFAIIGLMGLATDVGRVYVARAELGRSVDAAALAGAKQLPDITLADAKARAYINQNEPGSTVIIEVYPDVPSQQVEVRATKTVKTLFMRVLGIKTVQVKNQATAGFGIVPVDAYLSLDATGSMHNGCNASETNTGGACPMKEARDGATSFVNTLISATDTGETLVGTGAYRGCFNLPRNDTKCIDATPPGSMITNLSYNKPTLTAGIASMYAVGGPGQPTSGSGTNNCLGLKKAQDVLFGPGYHTASNTRRFAVILSDGDNVYNAGVVNQSSPQSPDSPCRPLSPTTADGDLSANCRSDTQTQEGKLDTLTQSMANTLKAQGVEIYVIAFSVCGGINTSTLCNTSTIGNTGSSYPDSSADHNLLKCIASSTTGTNDHYFETATAAELPGIFQQIAQAISFRLIK